MPSQRDELQLLSMFQYAVGIMAGMVALVPALHLFVAVAMTPAGEPVDALIVQLLGERGAAVAVGFLLVLGFALGGLLIAAGLQMSRGRHLRFCLFASAAGCLFPPFGTLLGAITLPLLRKPSTRALFGD